MALVRSSQSKKLATKPRPKNVVFESAADALNPPAEEKSIEDDYVIVENLDIEIEEEKNVESGEMLWTALRPHFVL